MKERQDGEDNAEDTTPGLARDQRIACQHAKRNGDDERREGKRQERRHPIVGEGAAAEDPVVRFVMAEEAMQKEQARELGHEPHGGIDEPEHAERLDVAADTRGGVNERHSIDRGWLGREAGLRGRAHLGSAARAKTRIRSDIVSAGWAKHGSNLRKPSLTGSHCLYLRNRLVLSSATGTVPVSGAVS